MSGESSDLIQKWTSATVNDHIKPLQWLIGTWKSLSAEGSYPTIAPFNYCEILTFTSFGQPLLNYTSVTWDPNKNIPKHLENGFLKIEPGTKNLAFTIAQNTGITSLEEGTITGINSLKVLSKEISRMSFAKDPKVTKIERIFALVTNKLELTVNMETSNTEMTQHLKVIYEKIQ